MPDEKKNWLFIIFFSYVYFYYKKSLIPLDSWQQEPLFIIVQFSGWTCRIILILVHSLNCYSKCFQVPEVVAYPRHPNCRSWIPGCEGVPRAIGIERLLSQFQGEGRESAWGPGGKQVSPCDQDQMGGGSGQCPSEDMGIFLQCGPFVMLEGLGRLPFDCGSSV